jgi:hypothetical protein
VVLVDEGATDAEELAAGLAETFAADAHSDEKRAFCKHVATRP